MNLTSLIPWKKHETKLPVRRTRQTDGFLTSRNQLNHLVNGFFGRPLGISPVFRELSFSGDFMPRIDVCETNKEISVHAELPGMEPENINITLDHNYLIIRGEKRAEKEDQSQPFYRIERAYGSFCRSIPLPDGVDRNKVDATFKRGVLKVKLRKTSEAQRKNRQIPIKTK